MTGENKLTYLPLGGAGEIGMNMYLYGYGPVGDQRFILVDCGVTFPEMEGTPGVDLIMADPAFIAERADRLEAIIITHAHEDHVGALGMLWPRLQAPVIARPFTALIARNKLERAGLNPDIVREAPVWPKSVAVGPFTVGFVPVAHSIPECSALVIDTPAGRIFHSADLKLDRTPLVGEPFDEEMFAEIGRQGVKALTCDSTNVFSLHPGRSEADIVPAINALMREAKGLVVATTFASNIARLRTLAQAAHDNGRSVVVMGRAMNTMIQAGFAAKVLPGFPPITDPREAENIPRDHLFILATGSQGERRAAIAQLASQSYMGFRLKPGDTVLFSSKTIPGNEVSVGRILNQLAEQDVTVIEADDRYHVSGHANRPDLERVHQLLKPQNLIPMHGEYRHLRAHAELGRAGGIPSVIASNGAVVDLTGAQAQVIDNVETGRVYLDGTQMIGAMDGIVRTRIHMALRGHVVVSVMLEEDGTLSDSPWVEVAGLADALPKGRGASLTRSLEQEIEAALEKAGRGALRNDETVEKLVEKTVRHVANDLVGKKPVVTTLINRFEEG
ncbi:ribonuclease J [Halovulum dunhuangense]|uniref:Ribonuclease J n=1 Tax=Halovulum dunhuangense TaxID=1505036 RepID=A0A849L6W1_9RHOB|nr:ribonuclease J [Halovulum dunhuangense]NNU81850.1 ribonuclease J [Halovulum dunhuangense]